MDALSIAINYLAPHGDSFWRWSQDNEALEWADGTAIAFYDEVHAVIEVLGTRPLPPFQALVILLAACQYNWQSSSRFQIIIGYAGSLDQTNLRTRLPADWQKQLLDKLDSIHALLRKQHGTTEFKKTIADKHFESLSPSFAPQGASEVLDQLHKGIPALVLSEPGDPTSMLARTDEFITSIRCLLSGVVAPNADTVQLRIETGLSNLPAAAELADDPELPDVERLRRLLNHLSKSGEEIAGIARVAQDLMAAVHLPRAISEPDQMPLGGFSDISNRGPLDRLLITELAHDDETLAVRVALNEALYLRRESPPKTPQRRRAILVDTGIRLWGVPRVFATSVALALAATAEKLATVSTYRTFGDSLAESDFLTRDGLLAHLAALEPNPHPATATIEFLNLWEDEVDPVLITHTNVLTDPEFRQHLRQRISDEPLYIATVDNAGHYELFSFTSAGQKLLQKAKIDTAKLTSSPNSNPDTSELLRNDIDPNLPAIFSMQPFPLRVPHQFESARSTYAPNVGVITHTRDGRLMLWDKKRCGARLLTSELPSGSVVWTHIDNHAKVVHLIIEAEGFFLCSADIDSGTITNLILRNKLPDQLDQGRHYNFCHHESTVFIIYEKTAEAFSLHSGQAIGLVKLPKPVDAHSGRFLRFDSEWHALYGDLAPSLEKLPSTKENLIRIFESSLESAPSPIGLTEHGQLLLLNGDQNQPIGKFETPQSSFRPSLSLHCAISDDKTKIGLQLGRLYTFDIATHKTVQHESSKNLAQQLNPEKHELAAYNPTSHTKFESIDISPAGRILLTTPKGITHCIQNEGPNMILRPLKVKDRQGFNPIRFEEISAPGAARFKLQRASWPCGSRAYLDIRGFLHIVHCTSQFPEITFALRDGMLSGWTSENLFFGQNFYLEPHRSADTPNIYSSLNKITARILAHREANPA